METKDKLFVCPFCGSQPTEGAGGYPQCTNKKCTMHRYAVITRHRWQNAFCWDAAKKSQCVYCGHVGPKTPQEVSRHMLECERRPERRLIKASIEAIEERDALRKRVEELEKELETKGEMFLTKIIAGLREKLAQQQEKKSNG